MVSRARAERSSCSISLSQSSEVWCWMMKSSSSCCGRLAAGVLRREQLVEPQVVAVGHRRGEVPLHALLDLPHRPRVVTAHGAHPRAARRRRQDAAPASAEATPRHTDGAVSRRRPGRGRCAPPRSSGREGRQVVGVELEAEDVEVLRDPARGDRLGDHDVAELEVPAQDRLGRRDPVLVGDAARSPSSARTDATGGERAPGLGEDPVRGVEVAQLAPAAGRGAARPG